MSLLRSQPQLETPWKHLLTAGLLALMLPCALGVACRLLLFAFGDLVPAGLGQDLRIYSLALIISPFLGLAGLILGLPITAVLLRKGWFGWLSAGVLGFGLGALIGTMVGFEYAPAFGLTVLLLLRWSLGRLRDLSPASV